MKTKKQQINKEKPNQEPSEQGDANELQILIERMKTVSINSVEGMSEIKNGLIKTRDYRYNLLLTDNHIDLLEWFPYFFVKPDLVRPLDIG